MGKKRINPVRGFGARYGSTVRKRYIKIYQALKRKYVCSRCGSRSVVRDSVGVWTCIKCGLVFTGGAYVPSTKLGEVSRRIARSVSE